MVRTKGAGELRIDAAARAECSSSCSAQSGGCLWGACSTIISRDRSESGATAERFMSPRSHCGSSHTADPRGTTGRLMPSRIGMGGATEAAAELCQGSLGPLLSRRIGPGAGHSRAEPGRAGSKVPLGTR